MTAAADVWLCLATVALLFAALFTLLAAQGHCLRRRWTLVLGDSDTGRLGSRSIFRPDPSAAKSRAQPGGQSISPKNAKILKVSAGLSSDTEGLPQQRKQTRIAFRDCTQPLALGAVLTHVRLDATSLPQLFEGVSEACRSVPSLYGRFWRKADVGIISVYEMPFMTRKTGSRSNTMVSKGMPSSRWPLRELHPRMQVSNK
jgi:hypothetical protein